MIAPTPFCSKVSRAERSGRATVFLAARLRLCSAPAVDVTEDDKAYKVTAELPGLDEKNIDIMVSGDMLTLKGEKRYEKDEQDKNRYMSERAFGSFQRSFALPESVDRDKITADLSKGVLTITLPKTAEAQRQEKKIEVKAST